MLTHEQARERMRLFALVCEREAEERSRQLKQYFSDEREKAHETAQVVVESESSEIDGRGWVFSVRPASEKDAKYAGGCQFVRASDGAVFVLGSGRSLVAQVRALPPDGGWREITQSTDAAEWDASGVVHRRYPDDAKVGEYVGDDLVLRWSVSIPRPQAMEEDGWGLAEGEVRALLIEQNGLWEVHVDDAAARKQAMQAMRNIFNRTLADVASIAVPGVIHTGTRGEAELLAKTLARCDVTTRLAQVAI
jgi:hypothetical protein